MTLIGKYELRFSVLFILFLTSCQFLKEDQVAKEKNEEESFYSGKKQEDLWRIPLVRPYELVSATNSSLNDWALIVDNPTITGPKFQLFGDQFQFSGIYQVGVKDSIFRLDNESENWSKHGDAFPTTLLINAKTHELFIARTEEDKVEINNQLAAWGIETPMKMHFFDKVKNDFQDHGKLPWDLEE